LDPMNYNLRDRTRKVLALARAMADIYEARP
jgi:hypothetical protein